MWTVQRLGMIRPMAMPTHPPRWLSPALGSLVALLAAVWLGLLWQNPPDAAVPDPLTPRALGVMPGGPQADWDGILAAAPFGGGDGETPVAVETSLPLRLLGVIAENTPATGRALIAAGGGASQVYAAGATLPGGATLIEIYPTQVILQRAGRRESLALPENLLPSTPPGAANPTAGLTPGMTPQTTGARPSAPSSALGRLSQVMTWQSVLRAGQPSGVRVYPGADAGSFDALGLRPGDLVVSVNQAPLTDASGSRDFAALLNSSPTLQLGIEREGRLQTLQIDVTQLDRAAEPPP